MEHVSHKTKAFNKTYFETEAFISSSSSNTVIGSKITPKQGPFPADYPLKAVPYPRRDYFRDSSYHYSKFDAELKTNYVYENIPYYNGAFHGEYCSEKKAKANFYTNNNTKRCYSASSTQPSSEDSDLYRKQNKEGVKVVQGGNIIHDSLLSGSGESDDDIGSGGNSHTAKLKRFATSVSNLGPSCKEISLPGFLKDL